MARRRNKSPSGGVELNLTSMLDVIFNILAFFVMTFSPPIAEKNFDVRLPPPKLQAGGGGEGGIENPDAEPQLFRDVTITLAADGAGALTGIKLEQKVIPGGPAGLARELRVTAGAIKGAGQDVLEAANVVAPPNLKYRYLIEIVDACYQANIKKVNFAENVAKGP